MATDADGSCRTKRLKLKRSGWILDLFLFLCTQIMWWVFKCYSFFLSTSSNFCTVSPTRLNIHLQSKFLAWCHCCCFFYFFVMQERISGLWWKCHWFVHAFSIVWDVGTAIFQPTGLRCRCGKTSCVCLTSVFPTSLPPPPPYYGKQWLAPNASKDSQSSGTARHCGRFNHWLRLMQKEAGCSFV